MKRLLCFVALVIFVASASTLAQGPSSEAKYLGVGKCAMCHSDIHKSWQSGAHSRTFDLLANVGEEKNDKCLPCHTTGFGKGGFTDAAATPDLKAVTCEACHGPGGEHYTDKGIDKTKINRTPSGAVCGGCHQALNIHAI